MSNQNSKNFKLIVLLFLVAVFTFGYILVSNGINRAIYTDINNINSEKTD